MSASPVEQKQNPFSVYDFLGYLIPGAIGIYVIDAIIFYLGVSTPSFLRGRPFILGHTDKYIALILASYILGHFFSFLSSYFIERFSAWRYGYPSEYLLYQGDGQCKSSYFHGSGGAPVRKLIRTLVWIFNLPISLSDQILHWVCDVRSVCAKKLDSKLQLIIERKLSLFYGSRRAP